MTISLDGGGIDRVLENNGIAAARYIYGGVYFCAGDTCRPVRLVSDFSFGQAWERTARSILNLSWGEEGTVMAMAGFGDPLRFAHIFAAPFLWLPNQQYLARCSAQGEPAGLPDPQVGDLSRLGI